MTRRPGQPDRRWVVVCVGACFVLVGLLFLPSRALTEAAGDHGLVALVTGLTSGVLAGLGAVELANLDLRLRSRGAPRPPKEDE